VVCSWGTYKDVCRTHDNDRHTRLRLYENDVHMRMADVSEWWTYENGGGMRMVGMKMANLCECQTYENDRDIRMWMYENVDVGMEMFGNVDVLECGFMKMWRYENVDLRKKIKD
jgi:hypothetical protein